MLTLRNNLELPQPPNRKLKDASRRSQRCNRGLNVHLRWNTDVCGLGWAGRLTYHVACGRWDGTQVPGAASTVRLAWTSSASGCLWGISLCLDPSKAGSTHCSPACPHWPTYPGGPAAPANSGPAARPTLHWTAGDLPPGRGSMAAHPLPGLLMVDTGREDTAGRKGSTWSTDRPHHHFVTKPSGHAPTIKAYQDLCSGA